MKDSPGHASKCNNNGGIRFLTFPVFLVWSIFGIGFVISQVSYVKRFLKRVLRDINSLSFQVSCLVIFLSKTVHQLSSVVLKEFLQLGTKYPLVLAGDISVA